jgi:hypothetical protein
MAEKNRKSKKKMATVTPRIPIRGMIRQPFEWFQTACEFACMEEIEFMLSLDTWDISGGLRAGLWRATKYKQALVAERLMQLPQTTVVHEAWSHLSRKERMDRVHAHAERERAERLFRDQLAESIPVSYAMSTLEELHCHGTKPIKPRATEICVALQELGLPALLTLNIIDEACELAPWLTMHWKWQLVVKVKHWKDWPEN